ncbi:MAG TPA: protein kinase [bacterium]|nr:protein kinase [bacterium]
MIGKTVGSRYKVLEFVGRGGFAEVYLALDLVSRAVVAVKFLFFRGQGPGGAPGEVASRFAREARLATELDHPNLVKAFSSGTFEGGPFLIMEFVEGHTLKDMIDKKSSLPNPLPEVRHE